MTRFVMVTPLLVIIVLLAGAASAASAQSPGCGNGVAVADPAKNPGLVEDCEALLHPGTPWREIARYGPGRPPPP